MPTLFRRLTRYLRRSVAGWRLPLAIIVGVFLTSWALMALVEPGELTRPGNYWWYFVVTAATVGYGDFFPQTAAGHVVGAYVIVGGIVTLTLLFTRIADRIQSIRGHRMRGQAQLDLEHHVVLLGYTPGRTERLVTELTAEGGLRVALGAWDEVAEHPMPERPEVAFVRGDLATAEVLHRAVVERARTVVIDARDDDEALTIAVAVHHACPDAHIVVALRDLERREHFGYVDPRIQCVQWHMPFLITEEALDPGITQVYNDLMRSGGHGNTYSVPVPRALAGSAFGDVQTWFGRTAGATVLAVRAAGGLLVNPPWDQRVEAGTVLYYVAAQRLDVDRLAARR